MTPLCTRICPYPFFEATPPDPRLKPRPVFVASGGVIRHQTPGRIAMMKLAVFMMAVAIAATTVLSALLTSPERPMRTRIARKVNDAPPASFKAQT